MNKWHCDICGRETFMDAKTENVTETKTVSFDTVERDEKTGKSKVIKKEHSTKVPVMVKTKQFNHSRRTIEEIEVPKLKYLELKCIQVQIRVGTEIIERDFCHECAEKTVYPEIKDSVKFLENITEIN